ncbi:MAG: Rieske 2Fe-2S domain-containing protein [Flammeovirgaceae bacterium]|jgi:choline monooxygenase|nr:Rieske 2Fe-2S domain-containing protein [Flammeovirgaceae bacterium]|tara:strand:+ start:2150 stop:3244 length:1095 start_codon:yes stop_codon:yes gene_type:complete
MGSKFFIDPDITKAETMPASFYRDQEVFEKLKEKVFLKSWQWIGSDELVPLPNHVHPFVLLDHFLTEPMLLIRNASDQLSCLTNVCTHRGNIIANQPGKVTKLLCAYHGRRFSQNGTFEFMPEFQQAQDFPRACDDLHKFELKSLGPHLFVGMRPKFDFDSVLKVMESRIGFLPLDQFKFESVLSKDYLINAHWALYCDNYLEGFHIPFVHQDLNNTLDYGSYTTEIYDYCNLQIGYAQDGVEVFDLPVGHPDYGKKVAAYFYWIFPNMMFNFYPWGLSINIVKPISINKTKVSFLTYVWDESKLDKGAGALLDKVEREDEFVVEGVQNGIRSSFYQAGRFSPTREKGVHHFQSLLATFLNDLN